MVLGYFGVGFEAISVDLRSFWSPEVALGRPFGGRPKAISGDENDLKSTEIAPKSVPKYPSTTLTTLNYSQKHFKIDFGVIWLILGRFLMIFGFFHLFCSFLDHFFAGK